VKRYIVFVTVSFCLAHLGFSKPRTHRPTTVRYLINFEGSQELSGKAVTDFTVCLINNCQPVTFNAKSPDCPPDFLCEMVTIREHLLPKDNPGGSVFKVSSHLISRETHEDISKDYDFSGLQDIEGNRRRVLPQIRRLIVCHDRVVHHNLDNGAVKDPNNLSPECDCDIPNSSSVSR
jgi:hypothetical protein